MSFGKCVICSQPRSCAGYDTCGNTYCQEAKTMQQRARNTKDRTKRHAFSCQANAAIANRDLQLLQR